MNEMLGKFADLKDLDKKDKWPTLIRHLQMYCDFPIYYNFPIYYIKFEAPSMEADLLEITQP